MEIEGDLLEWKRRSSIDGPLVFFGVGYVAAPGAGDSLLDAKSAAPLSDTSCANPFSEAAAKDVATADFPNVNGTMDRIVSVAVDLVVHETGKIRDAWYVVPSQYPQINKVSLDAALATHYTPEVSLRQKVPSEYEFTVTFNPYS